MKIRSVLRWILCVSEQVQYVGCMCWICGWHFLQVRRAYTGPASFLVSNGGYCCRAPKVYSKHRWRHEQDGATSAATSSTIADTIVTCWLRESCASQLNPNSVLRDE